MNEDMFLALRKEFRLAEVFKQEHKRMHYKAEFHLAHKCHEGSVDKVQWEVKRRGKSEHPGLGKHSVRWHLNLERWVQFPCIEMMG